MNLPFQTALMEPLDPSKWFEWIHYGNLQEMGAMDPWMQHGSIGSNGSSGFFVQLNPVDPLEPLDPNQLIHLYGSNGSVR